MTLIRKIIYFSIIGSYPELCSQHWHFLTMKRIFQPAVIRFLIRSTLIISVTCQLIINDLNYIQINKCDFHENQHLRIYCTNSSPPPPQFHGKTETELSQNNLKNKIVVQISIPKSRETSRIVKKTGTERCRTNNVISTTMSYKDDANGVYTDSSAWPCPINSKQLEWHTQSSTEICDVLWTAKLFYSCHCAVPFSS